MKKQLFLIVLFVFWLTVILASAISIAEAGHWRPLPGGLLNSDVYALRCHNGTLWVGGNFSLAGSVPAMHVARHNGLNWIPTPNLPTTPLGFCVFRDSIYALGCFDFGGVSYGLARWTGSSWLPLGEISQSSAVESADVYDSMLVVGGKFASIGGVSATCLAIFDGRSFTAFSGTTSCSWLSSPSVESVYSANGYVYVGGAFSELCGTTAYCAAKWDGLSWTGLNVSTITKVTGFTSHNGKIYVAGSFHNAGNSITHSVAEESVGGWIPVGNGGVRMDAEALASFEGKLYIGGRFVAGGGAMVGNLGSWDGSQWTAENTGLWQSGLESVRSFAVDYDSGVMYAAGTFCAALGDTADYLAYMSQITLAVDLTTFACEAKSDHVLMSWQTASESNSDYFELSVAVDGTGYVMDYVPVGLVSAAGYSSVPSFYEMKYFFDRDGLYYFRLSEYDREGTRSGEWHSALCIRTRKETWFYSATGMVTCRDCRDEVGGVISIYSATGRLVESATNPIYVGHYLPGIYIARDLRGDEVLRFVIN